MTSSRIDATHIAFIEPVCRGLEHASFNAAMLASLAAAAPESMIAVYAEESHLAAVRDVLTLTRPAVAARIAGWTAVDVPPRKAKGRTRTAAVRRLFRQLDPEIAGRRPSALVIATIDVPTLVWLKLRLFTSWRSCRTIAVFHELLAVLERRRS